MTYDEALSFWYGRIDFEKRAAEPGEMKLDRMRALLSLLGDPHRRLRIIHVAGTKGKGSTSAMLASVLRAAGYRVGLFTSPHLEDVSERILVDDAPITREEIAARMEEIRPQVHRLEARPRSACPTFFEVGTALGLLHFLYRRVDWVVLEVGLGGRLDSTNVCLPWLSIITNISYDHMNLLGNTLAEIAREKAGIIKPRRPVVCAANAPEAVRQIESIAAIRRSPLHLIGRDFGKEGNSFWVQDRRFENVEVGLLGEHQRENAATAIAAVEILREKGVSIPNTAIRLGLKSVNWPARMQVVRRDPLVILDCAHNIASIEALIQTLDDEFHAIRPRSVVLAISTDKQVAEIVALLAPHFDHFLLTRYSNNPRCTPPERLAKLLWEVDSAKSYSIHMTSADALDAAIRRTPKSGAIVITGSVFLAGELRPALKV